MAEDLDVLVVGGGPAGLSTAFTAAAAGRVLVVHRDREIGVPVRTSGGSWQGDMDALGIPPSLYSPIDRLVFAAPNAVAHVRFGRQRPVVLDVTETYRFLADLARRAGAEIACATRFAGIAAVDSDGLTCELVSPKGPILVRAAYVVDASGWHRAVLRSVGAAERPMRFGVGVEHEFEDLSHQQETAALIAGRRQAPNGYAWVFPRRGGSVCIGVGVIRPEADRPPDELLEALLASGLPERLGFRLGARLGAHGGIIPADGPARKVVHGRVVAVGDSAGQALPLIGEGIRFCIEAGRRAGAAIANALTDANERRAHLCEYERWWAKRRRRWERAQKANLRLCGYTDLDWDDKARLLSLMTGDEVAAVLRMEVSTAMLARLLARHPFRAGGLVLRSRLRRVFGRHS